MGSVEVMEYMLETGAGLGSEMDSRDMFACEEGAEGCGEFEEEQNAGGLDEDAYEGWLLKARWPSVRWCSSSARLRAFQMLPRLGLTSPDDRQLVKVFHSLLSSDEANNVSAPLPKVTGVPGCGSCTCACWVAIGESGIPEYTAPGLRPRVLVW